MHRRQGGGGDVENVRAPPCGLQRGDEKGTLCSIDDTVDNPEHRDVGGGASCASAYAVFLLWPTPCSGHMSFPSMR